MHIYTLNKWKHHHDFLVESSHGEKRTWIATVITFFMMIAEIIGGIAFGSMALLADGWHMGTHVAAFGITIFAYRYAKKHAKSSKFSFGAGKVTVLGGFASAVALAVVALVMVIESLLRFIEPTTILFNQAIAVAVLGLIVNGVCAVILQVPHTHHHEHEHKIQDHHDHNLKAAYFHVLADALTSILAIIALFAAKYFNWIFMDPFMGIVGSIIITRWAYGLLKETGPILLDAGDEKLSKKIINIIESDSDNRIVDLHIWPVGPNHMSSIISIVTHFPNPPEYYQKLLAEIKGLAHVTFEINECTSEPCIKVD
jgi:cation diffusion facilitator family transporter